MTQLILISLPSFLSFSNTLEDNTYALEGPINQSLITNQPFLMSSKQNDKHRLVWIYGMRH